jgi:hypothetical protein
MDFFGYSMMVTLGVVDGLLTMQASINSGKNANTSIPAKTQKIIAKTLKLVAQNTTLR